MDGNNRWAVRQGIAGHLGHRAGVEVVRAVMEACEKKGVEVLTLFAFSSENWGRPEAEVRALMALLYRYLRSELEKLQRDGIRLRIVGRRDRFSPRLRRLFEVTEAATADNTNATLVLALDYGGRWDIASAARQLAESVQAGSLQPDQINEETLESQLSLSDLPPPDLCIRTAGEQRMSNFLLWHLAYSEFFFTDTLWPDFDETTLDAAIADYQRRERRFGVRKNADGHDGRRLGDSHRA
ncbi:undecaprenyl pyrophosphate synthetase 1 [Luminiphilus syltensis NOR5-1B]|uniref:Ditrans,polycis-undecaprenyl-diphosphate synthase ((2E,6E)-farnesyl-diphosphate specific) n=2 Tax=Luminiphilus TaxID=1341118 RepID=B8KY96_9GAMM|nr:undecaprenyl pyrophosphate synthetase 1 [Luminiphilus syltensis NOR5-1B]